MYEILYNKAKREDADMVVGLTLMLIRIDIKYLNILR